ncbi:MAG: Uma2 family endonuclease [Gemmatimonadaceae bacterium]|nr:Uma2 family endonuclease [Gemmatimonadaceae bacterium]
MPALAQHYWTAAEVRELPDDGKRYECIDGELLVTPSPRGLHQRALREVFLRIHEYIREHNLGELLWSPADIELERNNLVQPDLFVALPREGETSWKDWHEVGALLLAIEVLSPSTARYDRVVKRKFYQRIKVGEYWIVDLDARVIERWRSGDRTPEVLSEELVWGPAGAPEPLHIALEPLFRSICG